MKKCLLDRIRKILGFFLPYRLMLSLKRLRNIIINKLQMKEQRRFNLFKILCKSREETVNNSVKFWKLNSNKRKLYRKLFSKI